MKQEFIKYVQKHPPQPVEEQTAAVTPTTVSNSLTVVYDIAAREVESAKNAPPEKTKAVKRFLDYLNDKDNRVIVVQTIAQTISQTISAFVRYFLSSDSSSNTSTFGL